MGEGASPEVKEPPTGQHQSHSPVKKVTQGTRRALARALDSASEVAESATLKYVSSAY